MFLSNGNFSFITQSDQKGGVIEISQGNVYIDQCFFFNNSKYIGGAIYLLFPTEYEGKVLITNNIFEKNNAMISGGILIQTNGNIKIFITNSKFLSNFGKQGEFTNNLL